MRTRPGSIAAHSVLLFLLAALGCTSAGTVTRQTLTDEDRAEIRSLDTAFVQAWLRDDTAGVLQLFHPNAVLLPPGGAPVEGRQAIRAYWWPNDGSQTRITSFTREIAEIDGTPALAYFRGVAALGWTYRKAGKESAQSSRSTDLVLVTPDSTGRWRILRQMWSQQP